MAIETSTSTIKFPTGSNIIRIPCEEELYTNAMMDNQEFKCLLNSHITVLSFKLISQKHLVDHSDFRRLVFARKAIRMANITVGWSESNLII